MGRKREIGSSLFGLLEDPADSKARTTFAARYRPVIAWWCCKWGLHEADAKSLSENVLAKVLESIERIACGTSTGKLGCWLATVTEDAWVSQIGARIPTASGSTEPAEVERNPRDDWESLVHEICERELFEEAIARVQPRLEARSWQAFELFALGGTAAGAVAERLGMSVAAVCIHQRRVREMVQREIGRLRGSGEAGGAP